jgi:hypothetical protein
LKSKNQFVPRLESLEERCTPVATATQFGNAVVINADPAGGTIIINDNGQSGTGAIKVFGFGLSFSLDGTKVDKTKPISVFIFGGAGSDTVFYNLTGNLTTVAAQIPAGQTGSAGRIIQGDLGSGSTDTFKFNWPFISTTMAKQASMTASGLLDAATFSLAIQDHAKTENLSANLNIDAYMASPFVGLVGGHGVDNLAINENIFDLTGSDAVNFPATSSPNVSNSTLLFAGSSKKESHLVDLPVLAPGLTPGGSQLTDPNQAFIFGNGNDIVTVLQSPQLAMVGVPGTNAFVFGVPGSNLIFV